MPNGYTPSPEWADKVPLLSTRDLVQGGETGDSNIPLKALADRSEYLLENAEIKLPSYAALRAYTDKSATVDITQKGIAGRFYCRGIVASPTDNGGTCIIDALGRLWEREFSGEVNAKWFGAVGDGVASDSSALNKAIDYVAKNGLTLHIPGGTYICTVTLTATEPSNGFHIKGDGKYLTKIKRNASYGSVISFSGIDNFTISDLFVDGNYRSFTSNANHGIVFANGSNVRISRVAVYDWKNTAVIGHSSIGGDSSHKNNVVENVDAIGTGLQNNGILYADQVNSGFVRCNVVNIGKVGSPCYGIQLKENCQDCYIEGGYVDNSRIGVACGNSKDFGDNNINGRIHGVKVSNSQVGIALGSSRGYIVDSCIIDMNDSGNAAIDFNAGSTHNQFYNMSIRNVELSKQSVLFRNGDSNNVVHLSSVFNSSGALPRVVQFSSGSSVNSVSLELYMPPTDVTNTSRLVENLSNDNSNIFDYKYLNMAQFVTISSDSFMLEHGGITQVQLDTEGSAASDDLSTINGGRSRQVITINQYANARKVTVKHGTGNIRLNSGADFTFANVQQNLTLMFNTSVNAWVEVSRGVSL